VNHPALLGFATAATGFMRQMAIKPFAPRHRSRELALHGEVKSLHAVRSQIYKEKGVGAIPTIVIAGFVPNATEVVEFQRPLFKRYGSIYYLNYPGHGFDSRVFFAQLADLIEDINRRGKRPVIFSISFGCGLLNRFLREHLDGSVLEVRGVVLASPVLCTEDLVRPDHLKSGGVRMLESNLKRILRANRDSAEEVNKQIERARRCFQALFEAGAENRPLTHRHLSIRSRIMNVVENTPVTGGYERVLALKELLPPGDAPVFSGPTLALLAEQEESILVPTSPTLAALRDPQLRTRLFPRIKVREVVSRTSSDAVSHASLIFHHHCYNPLIAGWYDKLRDPALFAVV
jgi:hypothetical protein